MPTTTSATRAAAFAAALLVAAPALAGSDYGGQERQVLALLDAHHAQIAPAKLKTIGRFVPAILQRAVIAGPGARRHNALALLAHFPQRAAFTCGQALRSKEIRSRRAAMLACAMAAPARATEPAKAMLRAKDPTLREAAVDALLIACTEAGLRVLKEHRSEEHEGWLQQKIDAARRPATDKSERASWRCARRPAR